jgi:hypothetical protein
MDERDGIVEEGVEQSVCSAEFSDGCLTQPEEEA